MTLVDIFSRMTGQRVVLLGEEPVFIDSTPVDAEIVEEGRVELARRIEEAEQQEELAKLSDPLKRIELLEQALLDLVLGGE